MSVSFDRAAGYYDRTRTIPDSLMANLLPALLAELPKEGACIEIGVGTGRIALPLVHEGVRLVGVDISREMLLQLVINAAGAHIPIALADATQLPFRDRTFTAAIAAHVLHLIPNWKAAVDELTRVLTPGAVILVSRGALGRTRDSGAGPTAEWDRRLVRQFFAEAGDPPWPPGLDAITELDQYLGDRCSQLYELPEIFAVGASSVNDLLATLEAGYWAACWNLDESVRTRSAEKARDWARAEYGDLDSPRPILEGSFWHVYRLAE